MWFLSLLWKLTWLLQRKGQFILWILLFWIYMSHEKKKSDRWLDLESVGKVSMSALKCRLACIPADQGFISFRCKLIFIRLFSAIYWAKFGKFMLTITYWNHLRHFGKKKKKTTCIWMIVKIKSNYQHLNSLKGWKQIMTAVPATLCLWSTYHFIPFQ